ncbi:MAG: YcaO-like family protein [Rhodospirillales bacterium]|nr:YcaO-like family protein [Rhodospirillales bacterium]
MRPDSDPSAPPAARNNAMKRYRSGTHRIVPPAATLAWVRPLLQVIGITRIANVTGLDRLGIPVVMVTRPNARSIAVSQGKGLSLEAAKASGVMEAIETWHAETILAPLKFASFDDMHWSHRMIDIAGLPMTVDSPYHDDLPILWIEGRDLVQGGAIWLPYEMVHTNYTLPAPPGSGCFVANTNGLASGNHRSEAVLHGICEIVERDATTLWHLSNDGERQRKTLDDASVDDSACCSVLERFAAAGLEVRIWDVTSDVGIAAFLCLVSGRDETAADPEFGAGCHPAREIALLRALSEAAQARTTFISGARDDMGWDIYASNARARRRRACAALLAHAPARRFSETPSWQSDSIDADIDAALIRLQAVGITEVAVVDLTKPALRIPVVRVVIPRLEGAIDVEGGFLPGARGHRLISAAP